MNLSIKIIFLSLLFLAGTLQAQNALPAKTIKDLKGKSVKASELKNESGPMIISFWATWCKPCLKELNAIADVYDDWKDETGVKLVAISIDDARAAHKLPSFVNGQDWDYEVYLDENGDLKRAMNVVNVPHTFLLNEKGEIVYQRTIYAPGDEELLYEKIQKLKKGE
ncbi:MAG: TlpA family protein disulfide reductase [Bacteroidia bacterium]|nr:TlpA family protein disulfide reductase [Bacteroidia bacterium]